MLVISTNLNRRFRSLDSLDIDACDNDIIPYKIDIQNFDTKQHCSFAIQNDDKNNAIHVSYRPNARIMLVNVAVVW
jgi:hypothetical protein